MKVKDTCIQCIELYQKHISPDHSSLSKYFPGGYCKFTPTCSEYTKQAIVKYGVTKGIAKGTYRILRCNPWNKGGEDKIEITESQ